MSPSRILKLLASVLTVLTLLAYLGYLVARRILQNDELESAYVGLDLPDVPLPGYRGNPWFLPIIGGWYRFRDRVDRMLA